ncbi:MAG TPA: hypothetical protein VEC38_11440 [Candidatus Binataceae bacterium]|nr:hypothetical protein [Candidatus Binataceae bacterium]
MKKAKIADLRDGLSRYLDHVRAGGTVIVYERDTPVAEIVPFKRIKSGRRSGKERLAKLERKGLIRRGRGRAGWLKSWKPVKVKGSVLEALLEERESGR